MISQLISALKYLHNHKIIHRYIKSFNILLTHDKDAKIICFKLSKFLESSIQKDSTFDESFFYMSPEILSDSNYSYPTDICSLGIAFHEFQL
jgi:NIMA (never in mitosis gene a)-related kinase